MCGRYTLTAPPEAVKTFFGAEAAHEAPPRHDIRPTQPILIAREERPGVRTLVLARWGLIPGWAKDPSKLSLMFNARSEGAIDKPSFRGAMRHKRCLIPATGFYEWQKRPGAKSQPYRITPKGGGLVAFAGLWEDWSAPDGGVMETATILTTSANEALAPIHERMPVVIHPDDFAAWLDVRTVDAREAVALMRPTPDDLFDIEPVGDTPQPPRKARAAASDAGEPSGNKDHAKPEPPRQFDLFS
ncbi:SOS response-associated peptidase [Amorphus coralli]|uniref:SOS response-associated peptidase n=1 Tax=Amorphus coralli TaxID=340680 RepID=UPI00037BB551|nr:SOS response-associated peptidase [Amorphus coralli]